ncbi:MAG: hypothetical protein ACHQ50_06050 [Fimbriimonadales bacterium]
MFGHILACAVFGYFAIVSLVNACVSIANREKALAEFGPEQQREGHRFLRVWLSVNVLAFVLMALAAILVWTNWPFALVLACAPVLFFALANLMREPKPPGEDA